MEFASDARMTFERNVNDIKKKLNVYPGDQAEIEKELRTMLFERAESIARGKGSNMINLEDVMKAISDAGTEEEIVATVMAAYSSKFRRAGLLSRTIAYVIDVVIATSLLLIISLPAFLLSMVAGGFDDRFSITMWIMTNLFLVVVAVLTYVTYFVLFEEHFGKTPGKAIMGLKVLKTDGGKIGLKESILRNIPKFLENVIIIDAIIMLVFFNKEKQRAFDRVANTMVIHA